MNYDREKFETAVWEIVSAIPKGYVMGYGEVAKAAGYPRHSRMVSKAMSHSPETLPWHRVIKSDGTIAFPVNSPFYIEQTARLKEEGVQVTAEKVSAPRSKAEPDLDQLLWGPEE